MTTWDELKEPLPPRQPRGGPSIRHDTTPLPERPDEPFADVWWQGRQWLVTAYGLECWSHYYHISADRIAESDWVVHMDAKPWVDIEDFRTALCVGAALHGVELRRDRVVGASAFAYPKEPARKG